MRRTLRTAVAALALLIPAAVASASTPDGAKEEAPKTEPAKPAAPAKKVASHKKDATKDQKDKAAPAPATPAK